MIYFYIFIRPLIPCNATAVLTSWRPMEWDQGPFASSNNTGIDSLWSPVPGDTTEHRSRFFAG